MQERRRRLIKYLYKKEGKLNEFEEGFKQSISKKSTIIRKFTSIQLEDLLRTSTKNVAQEVVSSLIPQTGGIGVLADVDKVFGGSGSGGVAGGNTLERRKNQQQRKSNTRASEGENNYDDGGYDAGSGAASGDNNDISNRGSNVR